MACSVEKGFRKEWGPGSSGQEFFTGDETAVIFR
jgi:hypothetical protein